MKTFTINYSCEMPDGIDGEQFVDKMVDEIISIVEMFHGTCGGGMGPEPNIDNE